MTHLKPERMADFDARRMTEAATRTAQAHLDDCQACAQALTRIRQGRVVMAEIRDQEIPDLGWESIAARIYWSTSSEQRAQARATKKNWRLPLVGALVLAGAMLVLGVYGNNEASSELPAEAPSLEPVANRQTPKLATPFAEAASPLEGLVTFAEGEVELNGAPLRFDQPIIVGAELLTADGRAVVQFGDHSAFRIAAQSHVRLTRFDSARIELAVTGAIDVDLIKRLPGQEFVVVAGDHEVLVRGTAFRVEYRDDDLGVTCSRGKVEVRSDTQRVPVSAGYVLRVFQDAWAAAATQATPMDAAALEVLEKTMSMPMLPAWSDEGIIGATTVLEVEAKVGQRIAIDGVNLTKGSFLLRTMSGRHQVALVGEEGESIATRWVTGAAGRRQQFKVALEPGPNEKQKERGQDTVSKRRAQTMRKAQLSSALEGAQRTERCMAPLAKQGLMEGAFAEFEVGVNADGSLQYLNLLDSNLSGLTTKCLRSALDAAALPAGPIAGFRIRLAF